MAPRQRKSRTSRMDAAIDAMATFGFPKDVVIDKMHELLKEYGGNDGYAFIEGHFNEGHSYRVLLEALLDDQEKAMCKRNQDQFPVTETSKGNEMMIEAKKFEESHVIAPAAGFTDIPVCSSTPLTIPPLPPGPPPSPPPPPPPVIVTALPLPETVQPQRRKPCHGWISNDDEKWHFITLPSSFKQPISPPETPPPQPNPSSGKKKRPKRRSRWDLMPEDM